MDVRAGHGSQATEKGAKTGEPAQAGALKTAQQLQAKRTVEIPTVLFRCRDMRDRFPESQKIRKGRGLTINKIKMNDLADTQVKEVFENFVIAAKAKGLSDVTIKKYHGHLISIGKHLDIEQPLSGLSKMQLNEMVVSMRGSGLAQNDYYYF